MTLDGEQLRAWLRDGSSGSGGKYCASRSCRTVENGARVSTWRATGMFADRALHPRDIKPAVRCAKKRKKRVGGGGGGGLVDARKEERELAYGNRGGEARNGERVNARVQKGREGCAIANAAVDGVAA